MPMTKAHVRAINRDRLSSWEKGLTENHCTPALLLGIGHDHRSGELHICVPENLPQAELRRFLLYAIAHLGDAHVV